MDPAAWELYQQGDPNDWVRVILRLTPGASPPPNVIIVARFDDVVTARIRRADTPEVWGSESVQSLKAPRILSCPDDPETDSPLEDWEAAGDERMARAAAGPPADVPEDGTGVIVGFCDWGFDFTHPNFRNPDGTTRLHSLWDQRAPAGSRSPRPYGYGRVYSRAEINRALSTPDPCASLGYHPAIADGGNTGSHGTHVADIAVGNRREPGSVVGLAPNAEIVFVHLGNQPLAELDNLGDSCDLLEGLAFVRDEAAGRPCVLHLSAGKTAGPHRGSTCLERAIDSMLKQPGLALVQSVGNYASADMHTHARVGPNQTHGIEWLIPLGDRTPNELEVWYGGQDIFAATLHAPTGEQFTVPLGGRLTLEGANGLWGNFYHRKHESNSGLNHLDVFLYPSAPGGRWRLEVLGIEVVDGRLHAWIERDARGRYQSRFPKSQATSLYTTNTICNSFLAIAVGAHDATQPDRPSTRFSSRGPTADGRQKPELSAPGYQIQAARSLPRDGWGGQSKLCTKSGTSMAAPWVSGTVALMFQAAGRLLTIHEVRSILIGTADPPGGPAGRSSTRIGYGYLNVKAAVTAARALGAKPGVLQAQSTARPASSAVARSPIQRPTPAPTFTHSEAMSEQDDFDVLVSAEEIRASRSQHHVQPREN